MAFSLYQEFISSNEATLSWAIDTSIFPPGNSKPILCLSDINQSSENTFSTVKYQMRSNEYQSGTYTFTNLPSGSYIAEIIVIGVNTTISSQTIPVDVYQIEQPQFVDNGIIPSNRKFTISLVQPNFNTTDGYVNFILFGQLILGGIAQETTTGTINLTYPINETNTYVIENESIYNNVEYEVSCFYRNNVGIFGNLSVSKLIRPTNIPDVITELDSVYNSVSKTLTITHNMPINAVDYNLIDCRATITDAENNVTYYYSSENSANLNPPPTAADPVVFNLQNEDLLPVDIPFTVTLSVKNQFNLWGISESPAIYCIHTNNYCAVPLSVNDLTFSVGLNNISITDKNTYVKNTTYDINYTATLYECHTNGEIYGSAVDTKTQTNDMNFEFTNLTAGQLYKVFINLNYTYTFSDNTTATIEQNIMNTCYKYLIPHAIASALTISATPSDENITVNWAPITQEELNGFILDYYEVSDDGIIWNNKNTLLSHNFSGLINGSTYTFFVRAVSTSGNSLYLFGQSINGVTASITSIPYGTPSDLTKVSQLPENEKCTVVWTISADPYNGGLFNSFEASVNSGSYNTIEPSFDNDQYTYEFTGLNNLFSNNILIRLVNNNKPNTNNVDTTKNSNFLSVVTTPYPLPNIPANLQASPDTTSITLSWTGVTPASIIDNFVQYEVYYKLYSDSDFTIVSNIAANSYIVTGLTTNSMYEFKVRSSIYNTEVANTFYSNFSTIVSSRTFVYLNAPNMVLEAGDNTIVAKLTPNVDNYFQTTFKYHATVSNVDGTNPNTIVLSNITNLNQQTITFTVLGDNSQLVDLTLYKVEAYYEMLNTDNSQYYSSNTIDNVIRPYNDELTAVLTSVSGNTVVDLTWDISAFSGYTIDHYEVSYDNVSWSLFTTSITQISSNLLTTITGLTNGESYNFYVRVVYVVNGTVNYSGASNMVTNIPYTTASAPINLTTTPSSQQITLSWEAPVSLNGLGLHYYQVRIEENNWINVGTNLSYTFTGLTNATIYTMYVKAVTLNVLEGNTDVIGDSASSYNLPYSNPPAPTFVGCIEGDQQLRLTWNLDTTGGIIDGYSFTKFMGSYDNGINWIDLNNYDASKYFADSQNPQYLFTGLTNGQSYNLKVYAVINHPILGLIDGNILTVGPFFPFATPSAPIFVSCLEGNEQLTLTWSQPSSLGGLTVHHYLVRTNTNAWINVGNNLSYAIDELTNGESYTISIKVVVTHPNLGLIDGDVYDSSSTFVPYTTAIAPTFKYASSFSYIYNTSNQFRFVYGINKLPGTFINNIWVETVGSNTGGLPLSHYEWSKDNINWTTMYNNQDQNNIDLNNNDQPSNAGFYLSAPEIGNTYTIKSRAVGIHPNLGLIPGITYDRNFLVYVPPSEPVISTNVAGDKSLTINWSSMVPYVTGTGENSAITTHGVMNGLPFEKFQVAVNNYGNGTDWINVGSDTSYTFTNLTNGTSYTPLIRAIGYDQYANSPQYTQITTINGRIATFSSNTPYAPANAPTLNAIVQSDSELNLTWNAPALGGLNLVRYEMSVDGSSWTSSIGSPYYTDSVTTPSFLFTSLTNGQSYNLKVRAITSHPILGEITGATFTSSSYVPYKASAAPTITVTPGNRQILLEWYTPDLGGLTFNKYEISYNEGTTWSNLSSVSGYLGNGSASSLTVYELTNGTSYTYSIRCVTTHPNLGFINSQITQKTATPFIKPNVVSNIISSAINNYLTFSFNPPANVNNNLITEYYEYSIDEGVSYNPLYELTTFITTVGDVAFSLKVRAFILNPNDNAIHVPGDAVTVNNLQNIDIVTPQNIQTVFGDGFATINWDAVSNITFQIIRYYDDGTLFIDYTTGSSYTFTGLTNGTAYRFGINIYTNGTAGPVSNVTITPMTTPTINSVSKSGDILLININFGGATTINVDFLAAFATNNTITGTTRSSVITYSPSVNPLSFSGMSSYNYFNITISNMVGTATGTYTI